MSMANDFKVRTMGGALWLIAVFSAAAWAETPAPADVGREDTYLDVLPKVDVPENVEPIPGAVNEEFRNSKPPGQMATIGAVRPEARALRDIYALCGPKRHFYRSGAWQSSKWERRNRGCPAR